MSEPASREVVYRHSLLVRLWHWVSALSVAILLLTGLYIFNMHPALYWGEDGHEGIPTFLAVKMQGLDTTHPTSTLQIGSHVFNTTGVLGHAFGPPGKQRPWLAFHPIMVFPLPGHLGDARGWHFLMAWVLVVGSLIYVGYGFATGHFRRNFVPTVAQLKPRAMWSEIWHHLTFRRAHGDAARQYNLLQRTAYTVVVFILIPLEVMSGLTMSSSFGAIFPQLFDLFGGRQSARTVHFLTAAALVLFVVIHVAQVFVAGIRNEVGAMISGRFTVLP